MSNYTEQDLEIDFRKEVGVSWERAKYFEKLEWLKEKIVDFENEKRQIKNLFIDGE